MKKNVLVTGGTGFVGRRTKALINVGYTVSILSRTKIKNTASVFLLHVGYRKADDRKGSSVKC
jgi:nucleoside-diphosphate-sugar epimerase